MNPAEISRSEQNLAALGLGLVCFLVGFLKYNFTHAGGFCWVLLGCCYSNYARK